MNLFQTIANPALRPDFLRRCKWTVPAREIFREDYKIYKRGGLSFRNISNPVERALKTYFRLSFSFGGKMRSGGFQVSPCDREPIKEVARWSNMLRRIVEIGEFWRNTCIENMEYHKCITMYGQYEDVVLFCDPPYSGTEYYYSVRFTTADHVFLAEQLSSTLAPVVMTLYDNALVRKLYPADLWLYENVETTTNSSNRWGKNQPKKRVDELILTRKDKTR